VSAVPFTRTLPYVLRDQVGERDVAVIVGRVEALVDSKRVTVEIGGSNVTVPKLASYAAPVVGDAVYLLVAPVITIALGTCK